MRGRDNIATLNWFLNGATIDKALSDNNSKKTDDYILKKYLIIGLSEFKVSYLFKLLFIHTIINVVSCFDIAWYATTVETFTVKFIS